MARDFDFPVEVDDEPTAPLIWIEHRAFQRATGEDLRTPSEEERRERLCRGLATLDADFPEWLEDGAADTDDGVTLRFRDLEAVRNVSAKLRDRGLNDR
jgi:hypothetical protein